MNTQIYVVEASSGWSMSSKPVASFLSKEEAEFYIYRTENEQRKNSSGVLSVSIYSSLYYSLKTVPVLKENLEGKEYDKFRKEKAEQVKTKIAELQACSEKDLKAIADNEKELERLTKD